MVQRTIEKRLIIFSDINITFGRCKYIYECDCLGPLLFVNGRYLKRRLFNDRLQQS